VKYKPPRFQFFGSATERFKDNLNAVPGSVDYVSLSRPIPAKKEAKKVPFSTTIPRFEKQVGHNTPGPGDYDIKQEIIDRIKEKEKSGYIGSFGTTDKRFKDPQHPVTANIGPGAYSGEDSAPKQEIRKETPSKENPAFHSKVPRNIHTVKKEEGPPPGSYDVGYYDISTKIKKTSESKKKPPFNFASGRFKEKKEETTKSNENDDQFHSHILNVKRRNNLSLDKRIREKMSSVFLSQTRKGHQLEPRDNLPGPGQYTKASEASWLKKTFNVNYIAE